MSDQVEVMPLRSFEYGGLIRATRKGSFFLGRHIAKQLEALGHAEIISQPEDPSSAAGEQQSALPAARASQPQTSSESDAGVKRGRQKRQDG